MIEELNKICKIKKEVDLTKYNTYRINSIGYVIVFPSSLEELKSALDIIKKYKSKWFIIGNGSNIILPEYYDGVIIKLESFNKCIISNNEDYVEAGYMINKLATELAEKGLAGLEWASGIPGTIGGSIYNNAGAYKGSISDNLISCVVFDGKNIIELETLIIEKTNKRIETQDLNHPSCGSVFRNPLGLVAGKLIDDLGLKGTSIGD